MLSTWRKVATNRPFVLFAVAMIGSYVLSFQVYLALPLQAKVVTTSELGASAAVAGVFAVSGLVTILGQLRVTAWCRRRFGPGRSMGIGLATMGAAFVPMLLAERAPVEPTSVDALVIGLIALITASGVLALGTAIVFPFEMDTIVSLSGDRLVATHYGLYNTVCGVGIMLGNLGTGWALDLAAARGFSVVPWLILIVLGALCAAALRSLQRRGLLPAEPETGQRRGRHRAPRGPTARRSPGHLSLPGPQFPTPHRHASGAGGTHGTHFDASRRPVDAPAGFTTTPGTRSSRRSARRSQAQWRGMGTAGSRAYSPVSARVDAMTRSSTPRSAPLAREAERGTARLPL